MTPSCLDIGHSGIICLFYTHSRSSMSLNASDKKKKKNIRRLWSEGLLGGELTCVKEQIFTMHNTDLRNIGFDPCSISTPLPYFKHANALSGWLILVPPTRFLHPFPPLFKDANVVSGWIITGLPTRFVLFLCPFLSGSIPFSFSFEQRPNRNKLIYVCTTEIDGFVTGSISVPLPLILKHQLCAEMRG